LITISDYPPTTRNGSKEAGVGSDISAGGTLKLCRSRAPGQKPNASKSKEASRISSPTAILNLRMKGLYTRRKRLTALHAS
jgi:hypothetical protein